MGLTFSISGYFLVGKFWQVFFGDSSHVSRPRSSANLLLCLGNSAWDF